MRRALVTALALLAACDLPGGSFEPSLTSLGLIGAKPTPAGTAVLRFLSLGADGRPASGPVAVWLDTSARALGMRLAPSVGGPFSDSIVAIADERGAGTFVVRFGLNAGTAILRAGSAASGLRDSIAFELGGVVDSLDALPVAPVFPGDSATIEWRALDSLGNRVFANPAVILSRPDIATVVSDTHIRADSTGGTWVRYAAGSAVDSTYLAIVPPGSVAAIGASGLWTLTGLRGTPQLTTFAAPFGFDSPRYSPSGDTLACSVGNRVRLRLPDGTFVQVVPAGLGFAYDRHPAWSADGTWIYFTAGYANNRSEIWRIHPDGSGATRIGPVAGVGERDSLPAVHPDDSLLAFSTNRVLDGGQPTLRIVNTNSGATVFSGPWGFHASFSPDGTRLAFVTRAQLAIAAADGSSLQVVLSPSLIYFRGQLSWSPDSRWIVAAHGGTAVQPLQMHLIDTRGPSAIRLPWSAGWTQPVWH